MQSGAAAGSRAAVEALRGLIRILALTLSDASTAALRVSQEPDQATQLATVRTASEALVALQGLSRRAAEVAAAPSREDTSSRSSLEAAKSQPMGSPPLPPVCIRAPLQAVNVFHALYLLNHNWLTW